MSEKVKSEEWKFELEGNDIFYCNDCDTQIAASGYDWKYIDGEEAFFECTNCGAKYKIVISRPIIKSIYKIGEKLCQNQDE